MRNDTHGAAEPQTKAKNTFQVSMTIIKVKISKDVRGGARHILHYEHDNLYL
jgi:hypothetical protein